jgi:hypothetical protein
MTESWILCLTDFAVSWTALGEKSDPEIAALMVRADLNKDGVIDYAEYDRLMNMQKYNDDQGGNLYVRNAIRFGLLKPDSILNDCVMVSLHHHWFVFTA